MFSPTPVRVLVAASVLLIAACTPAAPPSPTAAPAKPATQPTAAPAKPTAAPASPTAAASKAAPSPAAAPAKPAASPAAKSKPAAKPAATQAAQPAAAALSLTDAERAEMEAFYRGKTVRILVGFAAGGGYDIFARVTARHLSKYLPGSPNVIVENMTGAGSLTVANHVYAVAPKDGTVVATFDPALVMVQAVGGGAGAIEFDPARVPWVGSPTVSTNQCMVRTDSGVDSMQSLLSSQKEIVFGATTLGNSTSIMPTLMQHYLGAPVRIVTGFAGVNPIKLAVESGEADGTCGTWETFRATHEEWLTGAQPFAKVIVKGKEDPAGELKDVPLLRTFLQTEEARQILDMAMAPQAAGFVYASAQGTPATQLKALRIAFPQTWKDPAFQAEAEEARLATIPQDYATIEALFGQILSAPPQTLATAKEVLGIR